MVEVFVVVFNYFEYWGQVFDMKGQIGEVVNVFNDWKGWVISLIFFVIVVFGCYKVYFCVDEFKFVG